MTNATEFKAAAVAYYKAANRHASACNKCLWLVWTKRDVNAHDTHAHKLAELKDAANAALSVLKPMFAGLDADQLNSLMAEASAEAGGVVKYV